MPKKKRFTLDRSGLYYLADEYRQKQSAHEQRSIRDTISLLLPCWRSMSMIERKPYNEYVATSHTNYSSCFARSTDDYSSLARYNKRLHMLKKEHAITPVIPSNEEENFIALNLQEDRFLHSYVSDDLRDIYRRNFFFVTFQIYCRTDREDGGDYYPAEFAIMKYSFCTTAIDEYFTIMKPDKFPFGYTGTAIDHARETHQIPPFNFIGANDDYARIWQEVQRVIGGQ
jgi:hypothetical protein